jgi:hypothetical protein
MTSWPPRSSIASSTTVIVTIRGNSYRLRQHTELWQTLHAPQDPEPTARRLCGQGKTGNFRYGRDQ